MSKYITDFQKPESERVAKIKQEKMVVIKTVLNELIDILNQLKIDSTKPDCLTKRTGDYRIGLDRAITEASYLLDKERDRIKQAFENGFKFACQGRGNIR
jgi:hypothetical protein